ncbi:MAG: SpoIIE family protein phosphatase [Ignavibacteriaceae bacterium]|jgi:sigma-B regulation protein RsbU (phosphoserine phosphatase)
MEKNNSPATDVILVAENQKLKLAVEELSILNDVATAITSTQSLEKVIALMVQRCIKHLKVEQGAVMILDEQDSSKPFQTMIRKQDSALEILPYRFDSQLTGWMLKNKSPLMVNDLKNDKRFNFSGEMDLPVKTILSVPMSLKGRMIGLLTVFNKKSETGFSADDQRLLSIIAAQSAHVLENARLNQKEQDLIKMEEEFRMAKEIQLNILPKEIPTIDRYDIHAVNISAREVGGDYYDFIKLPGEKLAFCLGDITGKGLPAAMLMANLQATLRGQAFTQNSVKDSIKNANILLFNSTASNRFATVFYGVLNYTNNSVTYCNAGHDAPINIKGDQINRLNEGGLLLGCFDFAEYEEATKSIDVGESIIIYSDGVTEAMNAINQEFGEEKFISIVKANQDLSAKELIDVILKEIKAHSGDIAQSDDITLLIIKRTV